MITYHFENAKTNVSVKFWTHAFPVSHNHTFHEITFVCSGTIANVLDGKEHVMKKYDACLVKPHNVHIQVPEHSQNPEFHNIMINSAYLKRLCDDIYDGAFDEIENANDLYVSLSPDRHAQILKLLNSALLPLNETQRAKCLNLAVALLVPEFIPTESLTHRTPMTSAIEIMSNPKTMSLSIKEIARKVGYAPEHFSRIFKKEHSVSPQKLFFDIRMQQVKLLLWQTDMSIEEIARSVGINSLPYFYKTFRNYFNTTPAAMRDSFRNESSDLPDL